MIFQVLDCFLLFVSSYVFLFLLLISVLTPVNNIKYHNIVNTIKNKKKYVFLCFLIKKKTCAGAHILQFSPPHGRRSWGRRQSQRGRRRLAAFCRSRRGVPPGRGAIMARGGGPCGDGISQRTTTGVSSP